MKASILICAFLGLASLPAQADMCEDYSNVSPPPNWYENLCVRGMRGQGGRPVSMIDGGYSGLSDAPQLNPASLPTFPLPLGIEARKTNETRQRISLSAVQGMSGFGLGAAGGDSRSIY